MGYRLSKDGLNAVLAEFSRHYKLYAPHRFPYQGEHSDTDSIRYAEVKTVDEIELGEKSSHTFKEALIPISETLFFFTEDNIKESDPVHTGAIIFLRSCDLHAVKRLDEIYLNNGADDYYYKRLRNNVKFVLLGCSSPFENCFCVDMGTNIINEYDASLDVRDGQYYVDCKASDWNSLFQNHAEEILDVVPSHVDKTPTRVSLPDTNTIDTVTVIKSSMWDEYDSRCIACGRCNCSCPTCTCFTMQDIFYTDNGRVGERRRVWASCMVDKFTDVAGGGSYRNRYGERMRFKVLHKVVDFKQRFGYQMCVGCGRCDDVCPEYISFSHAVNKLSKLSKEGRKQ
ncbi:MAG: anaerobic sulfite reductase subunit AsrA [Tepidanaerobacteraceae bacterium]|jgi:anaerobic sulfite reductase subunit A|nr:anaerobic sulfite reductase subunit A [Tepidanaerobacter sp.]HQA60888.1 anaerobic sulfite reductase subunit AsrA [Tepidanaerobacteraceae bacterium]